MTRALSTPLRTGVFTAPALFVLLSLVPLATPAVAARAPSVSESAPLPKSLRYLGRFEEQEGVDHLMGVALVDDDHVATVSPERLAIVERKPLHSGTVTEDVGRYEIDRTEASNLDGAPPGDDHYSPKFFQASIRMPYAYVATRYDGLWVLELGQTDGAWWVEERNRLLVPREFTEASHIVGDLLFVTHHADGVEVADLASDPVAPPTLARLTEPLVDAWGIWAEPDGTVWVADGAAGLKMLSYADGLLTFVAGEELGTSPGTVSDVAVIGDWVLATVGGQGVAVYDRGSGERQAVYALPGACVDIEPIALRGAVLACRDWTHVVSVTAAGAIIHEAATRMLRRVEDGDNSVHIASRVAVKGRYVYVAGWDHLDAYYLEDASATEQPAIRLSGQRAQFAIDGAPMQFLLENEADDLLDVTQITSSHPAIEVEPGSALLGPGESEELTVTWDGITEGIAADVDLTSNDPSDPLVRIVAYAPSDSRVDPGETALDFTGTTIRRDYDSGEVVEKNITLSTFSRQGRPVYFLVFSTW